MKLTNSILHQYKLFSSTTRVREQIREHIENILKENTFQIYEFYNSKNGDIWDILITLENDINNILVYNQTIPFNEKLEHVSPLGVKINITYNNTNCIISLPECNIPKPSLAKKMDDEYWDDDNFYSDGMDDPYEDFELNN